MIDPESLRTYAPRPAPAPRPVKLSYFLEVGYRPLFLVAALVSVAVMLLWGLTLAGVPTGTRATAVIGWHSHEMLWGYGGAVFVGFLFTAVRNWTRQHTPAGPHLVALALLWLLARVAMAVPGGSYIAGALESAAWGMVLLGIGRAILTARNTRNYAVLGLVGLFGLSDLLWHLPLHAQLPPISQGLGLAAMTTLLVLVGGRIIPFFTEAGVGSRARSYPWIERMIWPLTLVAELAFALQRTGYVPSLLLGLLGAAAALAHGWRLWGWWDRRVLGAPLLWVLHGGYGAIVLHFACVPWLDLSPWFYSAALHLLTAGGLGLLTIGMLARVALGHGGRPLHVGPRTQVIFGTVVLAALLRIAAAALVPWWPGAYMPVLVAAAGLWALAFAGYLWVYGRILLRPGREPVE